MFWRLSEHFARSTNPARPQGRIRRRFPRLEGLEERCLLSGVSAITEIPLPSGSSLSEITAGITTGPDGNIWFTDAGADAIGMINTTTHALSLFTNPIAGAGGAGITTGPDGNLWFCEGGTNAIGMINPATHVFSSFALPSGSTGPVSITAGSNGNLWFTESKSHQIGEINPTTHKITEFSLASYLGPNGITSGPDGNVWFAWEGGGEVGKINPTTGAITYDTGVGSPVGITSGPDGNLWFTAGDLGKINPTTGAISTFATPNTAQEGITSGPDGNLWFSETTAGKIGQINPTTGAVTEYSIPYAGATPYGITAGSDGNVWFTDPGTNSIGVATLTTSQLVVTAQPPATVTAGSGFGLTVEAEDSSGDLVTSFNGTVTVALANNPGNATLGGTLTATASDGVATFSNLSLTTAAAGYTLDVSASGLALGVTSATSVTPAAATLVAITAEPPASVTAGSGFGLQATIEDQYGNAETSDNTDVVAIALASSPGNATLGGTLSATASNGVATFSGLTLTKAAAGYSLQASSSGLSSATSSAVTVTPAAATQVVITAQPPASVVENASFGLTVAIEDAYGNVETSSSGTIKAALDNNPGGAKLGGTLSLKASGGVAAFSGLTLNKTGTGYTLELTSSGLSGAVTNPITVTNSDAIVVLSGTSDTTAPDALVAPLVLDSVDVPAIVNATKRGRLS